MRPLQHTWRPADDWAVLVHNYYTIPDSLKFNGKDLRAALKDDAGLRLSMDKNKSEPNGEGLYHDQYQPYISKRRTHCYYSCPIEEWVQPPTNKLKFWWETMPSLQESISLLPTETRGRPRHVPPDVVDVYSEAVAMQTASIVTPPPKKRQRVDKIENTTNSSSNDSLDLEGAPEEDDVEEEEEEDAGDEDEQAAFPAGYSIYWDSTEASDLFGANEAQNALDRVMELMATLKKANSSHLGTSLI